MPLETEATAEIRALVADLKPDDADLLEALHQLRDVCHALTLSPTDPASSVQCHFG